MTDASDPPPVALLQSMADDRILSGADPAAAHAAAADWLSATAEAMRSARVNGNLLLGDVLLTSHLLRSHGLQLPYGPGAVRAVAFFALGAVAESGSDSPRLGVAEITQTRHLEDAVLLLDAAADWCRRRSTPGSYDAPPS